jgi:hypothetical protein
VATGVLKGAIPYLNKVCEFRFSRGAFTYNGRLTERLKVTGCNPVRNCAVVRIHQRPPILGLSGTCAGRHGNGDASAFRSAHTVSETQADCTESSLGEKMKASYRKLTDHTHNSSTYHKKDGTPVRAIMKRELQKEIKNAEKGRQSSRPQVDGDR